MLLIVFLTDVANDRTEGTKDAESLVQRDRTWEDRVEAPSCSLETKT